MKNQNEIKNTVGKLILGVMVLSTITSLALASSANASDTNLLLRGIVKSSQPISGATILVRDSKGAFLANQPGATNADGYFEFYLKFALSTNQTERFC